MTNSEPEYDGTVLDVEEMVEHLYDLDANNLRHLAYEALLISDGPDAPENLQCAVPSRYRVRYIRDLKQFEIQDRTE